MIIKDGFPADFVFILLFCSVIQFSSGEKAAALSEPADWRAAEV
ncbi:hypothetical protein [Paenibacillus sp. LHD-38]|nr:hypothetical protein [Paenibacillus sp. LHD-38]MDQ8737143.1 hypothetical protein [Paenibacillus sp. LHD-38]